MEYVIVLSSVAVRVIALVWFSFTEVVFEFVNTGAVSSIFKIAMVTSCVVSFAPSLALAVKA